jgi:hypothetical protein
MNLRGSLSKTSKRGDGGLSIGWALRRTGTGIFTPSVVSEESRGLGLGKPLNLKKFDCIDKNCHDAEASSSDLEPGL